MTREQKKLGFQRWSILSRERQRQLAFAHDSEHGNKSHYDCIVSFFAKMTDSEFEQYKEIIT